MAKTQTIPSKLSTAVLYVSVSQSPSGTNRKLARVLYWQLCYLLLFEKLCFCHSCLAELRKQELRQIEEHLFFHQDTGVYQCGYCLKTYKGKDSAVNHFETVHTDSTYPCEVCGKVFKSRSTKRQHVHLKHRSESKSKANVAGLM